MPQAPYQMFRTISSQDFQSQGQTKWRLEFEMSDTGNVSAQRERLTILTIVSPPLSDHPKALELAALLHVQALLDQQIRAMQSL